jgi:hypothetical protein
MKIPKTITAIMVMQYRGQVAFWAVFLVAGGQKISRLGPKN